MSKNYGVRYFCEPWNKPILDGSTVEIMPGIKKSKNNLGYADEVFVASIMHDEKGEYGSILLVSSEGGLVSRKMLEAVRGQIDHYLKHHVGRQ